MIHPDYQYTPRLLPTLASLVSSGLYECVLGSRILDGGALRGGMPWWKYAANRFLTFVKNLLLKAKLSEYHTGYRAFAADLLRELPLEKTRMISSSTINSRTSLVAGLCDWRGELPYEIFSRRLLDQFPPKCDLRAWLSVDRHRFRVRALGLAARALSTSVRLVGRGFGIARRCALIFR